MEAYALAAGVTATLTKLGEDIIGFFSGFSVAYAAEILLFYLLIYYVSKVLRDNDATRLMLVYWGVILVMGVMKYSVELFDTKFYFYFVLVLSMFMLILFNVEVKKSLWDVHNSPAEKAERLIGGAEARSRAEVERCISDIIKALQNMSKNNVGALIVLSKGNLPKQVLQSGVMLDAEISTQLIEGIFFPKAPLHDGAMIIRDGRICASGCFLPLSQNYTISKEMGTRHRAALGMSENSDAVIVVVSEETGTISIAQGGVIERGFDIPRLETRLRHEIMHKSEEEQTKESSVKALLRRVKK